MLLVFLIAAFAVIALIAILVQQNKVKQANAGTDTPNVKTVKLKSSILLRVETPLKLALTIEKNNWWMRTLGSSNFFPRSRSGDAAFDDKFAITAYRQDVMDVLQASSALRKAVMQLAEDTPSFSSIAIAPGKLTLTVGRSLKEEVLTPIRSNFAAALPALLKPFAELRPDTAQEARARSFDLYASGIAIFSFFPLMIVSVVYNQPLASNSIPWEQILSAMLVFLLVQAALLFALTTQGIPRLRGMIGVMFISLFFSWSACPGLVRAIDTLSQQDTITETVDVVRLYKFAPRKGAPHYYIWLSSQPAQLAFSTRDGGAALEITRALYNTLDEQSIQPGSKMEIVESTGLLGLPYVIDARPL